jgi:hypothetical protein
MLRRIEVRETTRRDRVGSACAAYQVHTGRLIPDVSGRLTKRRSRHRGRWSPCAGNAGRLRGHAHARAARMLWASDGPSTFPSRRRRRAAHDATGSPWPRRAPTSLTMIFVVPSIPRYFGCLTGAGWRNGVKSPLPAAARADWPPGQWA